MSTSSNSPTVRPFSWLDDETEQLGLVHWHAQHACMARDVSAGVAAVLQLLEQDDVLGSDVSDGEAVRILPGPMRGNLQRLAIASLELLRNRMDEVIEHVNAQAPGKAGG
jgi:hypothetical protein